MSAVFPPAELLVSMRQPREGIDAIWSVGEIKAATLELLLRWFKVNTDQNTLYLETQQKILDWQGELA